MSRTRMPHPRLRGLVTGYHGYRYSAAMAAGLHAAPAALYQGGRAAQ